MAQVQVGLGTVFGNKHLTVLERAHSARIHIQVRVQFQDGDLKAAGLKHRAQGSGGNAFAERRNHTASYKNKTCHKSSSRAAVSTPEMTKQQYHQSSVPKSVQIII